MPTYQMVSRQLFRSQECRNVFHYNTTDALDASQQQEAADAMRAAYADLMDATYAVNEWELYGATLRRVDVADLPGTDFTFTSGALPGTHVGDPGVPNQVCLLVSAAATTQKPRRSRSYLTGLRSNEITDGGFWSAAIQANAAVWASAMDSITVTGDTLLRVAVAYTGSPPAVTDTNRLTVYNVRANPAIQRRRRIGFGS